MRKKKKEFQLAKKWLSTRTAKFCPFLSRFMLKQFLYLFVNRFRRALVLLLKEPHGKSEPNMNSRILNNLSSTASNWTLKTEETDIEDTKL